MCATPCILEREVMFNLAEYRKKPQSLADFLPWVALVAEGVVLSKDGSVQRSARFRGPDLDRVERPVLPPGPRRAPRR